MECGIKLHGNGQAPVQKYWKELLRYIQEDKIHPLDMVTHRFKLEDMEKVYDLISGNRACRKFSYRQDFLHLHPQDHAH